MEKVKKKLSMLLVVSQPLDPIIGYLTEKWRRLIALRRRPDVNSKQWALTAFLGRMLNYHASTCGKKFARLNESSRNSPRPVPLVLRPNSKGLCEIPRRENWIIPGFALAINTGIWRERNLLLLLDDFL